MTPLTPDAGNPALAAFFAETSTPVQHQLDWLTRALGVPNLGLAFDGDGEGWPIGAATVRFGRRWFDFVPPDEAEAATALVVVARDVGGSPRELVAWCPRTDQLARHLGTLALLGEHELLAPRLAGPLQVHRGVAGWLRAGRRGVVILDAKRAWATLQGVTVAAEDIEHGLELRAMLTAPAPTVVVPAIAARQAA